MLHIHNFVFNPFRQNTYLLYADSGESLVIDPGFYGVEEAREFWDFIAEKNLQIAQIWLTHAHLDHIFGLSQLVEKTKLKPKLHQLEQEILDYGAVDALRFGVDLQAYTEPVEYVDEQTQLSFAGEAVQVLHTPGHSPGSLVFHFANLGFALVGDVLFRESIGRTDLRLANHQDLLHSLQNKLLKLPPKTQIYSGHGVHTTLDYELRNNPFLA